MGPLTEPLRMQETPRPSLDITRDLWIQGFGFRNCGLTNPTDCFKKLHAGPEEYAFWAGNGPINFGTKACYPEQGWGFEVRI